MVMGKSTVMVVGVVGAVFLFRRNRLRTFATTGFFGLFD
jgi:hypothetical protein